MPRFVLLYHRCPSDCGRPSHWDLMLESGDMLLTWALAQLPQEWQAAHSRTAQEGGDCPPLASGNDIAATQLADHRRNYLDYEGDLSEQRGSVIRVAEGIYRVQSESADCLSCDIDGDPLVGSFVLSRVNDSTDQWLLKCGEFRRNSG